MTREHFIAFSRPRGGRQAGAGTGIVSAVERAAPMPVLGAGNRSIHSGAASAKSLSGSSSPPRARTPTTSLACSEGRSSAHEHCREWSAHCAARQADDPTERCAAAPARQHPVEAGVVVPRWSECLRAPRVGPCWIYGDDFGDQESLVLSFACGSKRLAVCVLINPTLGGGVKDTYVRARVPTLHSHMFEAAKDDQVTFCEGLAPADASDRVRSAITSPEWR